MEAGASRSKPKKKAGALPSFQLTNEKEEQEAGRKLAAAHSKKLVVWAAEAVEGPQPKTEAAEAAVAEKVPKGSKPPRP